MTVHLETGQGPVFGQLFNGEGGYANLLHLLFTTPLHCGADFRDEFGRRLRRKLPVHLDRAPWKVRREVKVWPESAAPQKLDLVVDRPDALLAFELKVKAASARANQLLAQYQGLRAGLCAQLAAADSKRGVYLVYLTRGRSRQTRRLSFVGDDDGCNLSWAEVLDCFPRGDLTGDEQVLARLVQDALRQLDFVDERSATVTTPQREAVRHQLLDAATLFNNHLTTQPCSEGQLIWRPRTVRMPGFDELKGGLQVLGQERRRGQHLALGVRYDRENPRVNAGRVTVRVEFGVEALGRLAYGDRFLQRREALVASLETTWVVSRRQNGFTVGLDVPVDVTGSVPALVDTAGPVASALCDRLVALFDTFREFLVVD